jgi:carboxymethylenebutenolidase
MSGTMIEFSSRPSGPEGQANGRTASGYLALPSTGTGPGVLVIQEYWGLVPHIKDVADRFAAAGFVALAPDLFHGETTTHSSEAGRLMMALDIANTAIELRGAADYLLAHDRVAPKKVGAVGFCMGGQLALAAACDHPTAFGAAVDFYGIHPAVTPKFEDMRCAVQCHFAERDAFVAEADARALVERIKAAGKRVEAHFYPADHAFFNDARPEVYDADLAERAWQRTLAFLGAELV